MAKYREFKRPSVDLDPVGRTWGDRYPKQLREGDIVPGHGRVEEVYESDLINEECHVRFVSGEVHYFTEEPVFCFSEGEVIGNS